ncbi:MAG: hypothetical protein BIFFINMI_02587 [Phycisphaerae bacterium]|nr:hypothetical protein [Phycisphaerae bacterium]
MRLTVRISLLLTLAAAAAAPAAGIDELKVNREAVYEFTEKPTVTRDGDRVTIAFASKGLCDVTVAIEKPDGQILRHLVSGVLGPNAPAPLVKDSRRQSIVWDGKDDQGRYVDRSQVMNVRVSLGLRPRLERTLLWSPYKRYGEMPLMAAAPEGIYVYDGRGVDFIRLFDHEGNYVRDVYPFPADRIAKVEGLTWHDFPQGYRLPLKGGLYQHTLLSSGVNYNSGNYSTSQDGTAATAMAVRGGRMALAYVYLNRLATDGSSGGLKLQGPRTGYVIKSVAGGMDVDVGPNSIAFSPDGKTLYMAAYLWRTGSWNPTPGCFHAVYKLNFDTDDAPVIFAGDQKVHGEDNAHFRVPTSVATDAAGRVFIADYLNDRIQVYNAAGKFLKTIPSTKPAQLCIDGKTGEIWAFSYEVVGVPFDLFKKYHYAPNDIEHTVTRYSPMPEARQIAREPFPLGYGDPSGFEATGHVFHVELDPWAKEPTVWVVGRKHNPRGEEFHFSGGYAKNDMNPELWKAGVRIQRRVDGKWAVVRSFGDQTAKDLVRASPPRHNVQRLIVNPVDGMLYVAEPDSGPTMKASNDWLAINPQTGRIKVIHLPFNAMEAAFDLNGLLYLRNTDMIARYTFPEFREVPWDYGEERDRLGNDGGIYGRTTSVTGGLKMPSTSPVCYHQGGFYVGPNGNVVASCAYRFVGISSGHLKGEDVHPFEVYKPQIYPGRVVNSTSPCIHVWDKHGQLKYEDALPGVGQCDGVAIDRDDNIYVMQAPSRVYDGKRYFNEMSETITKVAPGKAKVISSSGSPVDLTPDSTPKGPPDLESTRHGKAWVPGAQWFFGGVGFAGFNMIGHAGGCACWFSRFTLDYFARSIAPEPYQYRVAVVDSAGNLILHIGQYGNVQDGQPLVAAGGPTDTRSIGGDEVSLIHACFVGTWTDHRIFIADMGNNRIASVKLDYYATERVPVGGEGK